LTNQTCLYGWNELNLVIWAGPPGPKPKPRHINQKGLSPVIWVGLPDPKPKPINITHNTNRTNKDKTNIFA